MPRQRYRRYFEPESNVTVPRQTASNATKRARTSDTSQNANRARGNGAGIVCPGGSTDSTTGGHTNCSQGQSTDPEEDGSQVQNSELEAGLSTSETEGEVPTGHNNDAPDFSHPGNQSSHNCDSNTEQMPCDQAPEEDPDAELSERELSGSSDDFSEYLGKLSEETISHQSTTKAQVLLLVLAYVVTAGLTWTQQLADTIKRVSGALHESLRKLSLENREPGVYRDVTDGDLYRSTQRQLDMSWSDLTLTFNTDGAPVFESSKNSIWPIQVLINELPVALRWQNIALSGLWFSKSHPPMHVFMAKFAEEVRSIGTIAWASAGTVIKSAVHVVLCCVDSPARAALLNMKQFNGYYGCSWCREEGTCVDGTVKYVYTGQQAPDRTHGRVVEAMRRAKGPEEPFEGFKGPSSLVKFKGLDLVWGLPPDYMHSILEGVTKQLADLWLSTTGSVFYIGRQIRLLDCRLGGRERIIEYISISLNEHDPGLHSNMLECRALHWAITEKFSVYLHCTVFTDNFSLSYPVQKKASNRRFARRTLAKYTFDVQHKPGCQNSAADAHSTLSEVAEATDKSILTRDLTWCAVVVRKHGCLRELQERESECK
ncbi:hypothetical protein MTO96_039584 [Rhipicephalus appendiculatus]